jgi:hypothetical protein
LVETLPVALKAFYVPGVDGSELVGTLFVAAIELLIFLAELFE